MKHKHLHDEPTEADRCEDVERQYRTMRRGHGKPPTYRCMFPCCQNCHTCHHGKERNGAEIPHVPIIFCPWCTRGNKPGEPPCCPAFTEAVDAIGKKQLRSVERQMREIRLGGQRSMHCPYCDARIPKPASDNPVDWYRPNVSPVCCELLHDAVLAVMQRAVVVEGAEQKKRIEDGLVSASRN